MTIFPTLFNCGSVVSAQEYLDRLLAAPEALEKYHVQTVQMDIMDGQFVDNVTITPIDMTELNFDELKVDLHLMVDEPMDMVYEAISVKDQLPIRAVIGQVEHMSYQAAFIEEVRQQSWLPGLALDLHTPFDAIDLDSWEHVKVIQIMGNQAGVAGQPLKSQAIELVQQVAEYARRQQLELEILVDIGVTPSTVATLVSAGVTGVAVGTALWGASDLETGLQELSQAVPAQ
jgi:ribulose-phosphate 3-epimerase